MARNEWQGSIRIGLIALLFDKPLNSLNQKHQSTYCVTHPW